MVHSFCFGWLHYVDILIRVGKTVVHVTGATLTLAKGKGKGAQGDVSRRAGICTIDVSAAFVLCLEEEAGIAFREIELQLNATPIWCFNIIFVTKNALVLFVCRIKEKETNTSILAFIPAN